MKSVLVAIPTNGKRKEVFDVIKSVALSLNKINIEPVFSVCADDTSIIVNKSLKDTICFSLNPEKFDYTNHIIEAIRRGISTFKPDFISTISDDFIFPARRFSNLIKPLLNGRDVSFGSWGSEKIATTYPKFQYLSELFVTRIANAAQRTSIPDYKNMLSYSFDYKSDFSKLTQLFTGLFAFKTKCWNSVFDRMLDAFGSTKLGWALEIVLFLSSVDKDLKITNVSCDRIKEKNSPVSGERTTRIIQMEDAFKYTNIFLKYTKQDDKLNKLSEIQPEMIRIVEDILIKSGA